MIMHMCAQTCVETVAKPISVTSARRTKGDASVSNDFHGETEEGGRRTEALSTGKEESQDKSLVLQHLLGPLLSLILQ